MDITVTQIPRHALVVMMRRVGTVDKEDVAQGWLRVTTNDLCHLTEFKCIRHIARCVLITGVEEWASCCLIVEGEIEYGSCV